MEALWSSHLGVRIVSAAEASAEDRPLQVQEIPL
jgi:hypothetical protein